MDNQDIRDPEEQLADAYRLLTEHRESINRIVNGMQAGFRAGHFSAALFRDLRDANTELTKIRKAVETSKRLIKLSLQQELKG